MAILGLKWYYGSGYIQLALRMFVLAMAVNAAPDYTSAHFTYRQTDSRLALAARPDWARVLWVFGT